MRKMAKVNGYILMVGLLGFAQRAQAGEPWGTLEDSASCEKEYAAHQPWLREPALVAQAIKAGEVTGKCKEEIEKRGKDCFADPEKKKIYSDPAYKITDAAGWCQYQAFFVMGMQFETLAEARAKQNAAAEKAKASVAKVSATRLPKVEGKNAAIETDGDGSIQEELSREKARQGAPHQRIELVDGALGPGNHHGQVDCGGGDVHQAGRHVQSVRLLVAPGIHRKEVRWAFGRVRRLQGL